MVRESVQSLESRQVKEKKEKRKEIAETVMSELTAYLADTPFVALSGVVGNNDYPKVVTEAVEKKLAAKQLLDEKETQKHNFKSQKPS